MAIIKLLPRGQGPDGRVISFIFLRLGALQTNSQVTTSCYKHLSTQGQVSFGRLALCSASQKGVIGREEKYSLFDGIT